MQTEVERVVSMSQGKSWYPAKVVAMKWLSSGYLVLGLETPQGFSFASGQYTVFKLEDAEGHFDCYYSIASSPRNSHLLEFCILSKNRALAVYEELVLGQTVNIKKACGNFGLASKDKPKVFIAGGSGVAPLRSMIGDLYQADTSPPPVHLVYGCQSGAAIPFYEEFRELQNSYPSFKVWFCAESVDGTDVHEGRVTDHLAAANIEGAEFYISGPPPMVAAVKDGLVRIGVDPVQTFVESY